MAKELNFKVILSAIHPNALEAKDAIASLLASSFNVPLQQAVSLFVKLPIILFDNLSTNDIKALKDHLLFFSKLGLDFNITPKAMEGIARANWAPKVSIPIVTCPTCGEMFYLMRCQDIQHLSTSTGTAILPPVPTHTATRQSAKPAVPPKLVPTAETKLTPNKSIAETRLTPNKPPNIAGVKPSQLTPSKVPPPQPTKPANTEDLPDECEDVNILSSEMRTIVALEEKNNTPEIEEIEEVGSISEELQEIQPEEIKKNQSNIPIAKKSNTHTSKSPNTSKTIKPSSSTGANTTSNETTVPPSQPKSADKKIPSKPSQKKSPQQKTAHNKSGSPNKNMADIEELGGISAEFEEIEGVSAEFERICMEEMDENIGSLSAEFEEIDGGVSVEIEKAKTEEKIGEIRQPMANIAGSLANQENDHANIPEMEDMREISSEFANIPDNNNSNGTSPNPPKTSTDYNEKLQGETAKSKSNDLKIPDLETDDIAYSSQIDSERVQAKNDTKSSASKTSGTKNTSSNKSDDAKLEPGNTKVFVTFNSKGDRESAVQLIVKYKGISLVEAKAMTETSNPITLFTNLSLQSAQMIRKQLEAMQFQVRIGNT